MLHIASDSVNRSWLRKIALDHVTDNRNDYVASVLLILADVKTAARSIVESTTMVLDSISKAVEETTSPRKSAVIPQSRTSASALSNSRSRLPPLRLRILALTKPNGKPK